MKVYLRTYGCQMNERDSDHIAAKFMALGCEIVDDWSIADIAVVNTCSVREQAEQKAIGKLGHLIDERRGRKSLFPVIGLTGCMAQNRGESILDILPQLDFVLGSRKTHIVADCAVEIWRERKSGKVPPVVPRGVSDKRRYSIAKVDISDDAESYLRINMHDTRREPGVCAFVSIMQGCSMNCSYCIVPKVRGVQRSRPAADIISEVKSLCDCGVKEVTLLGQVVNAYSCGHAGASGFVSLLKSLNEIEGLERMRFTSPHPSFFTADLIDAYSWLDKLCEYVHLPMQSGSDRILRAMNRPYTSAKFLGIVEKLRARAPGISISTDVIVGYPGETDADFEATRECFKAADFDMAYIFKYSPREGTRSAELPDDIPEDVKEYRNSELLRELEVQSKRFNDAFVGRSEQILVEGAAKRGEGMMMGRTRTHRKVVFKGAKELKGQIVNVKIASAGVSALLGYLP